MRHEKMEWERELCKGMISRRSGRLLGALFVHINGKSLLHSGGRVLPKANHLAVCSVWLVLASCASLIAQNSVATGALRGQVADASGAVVPRASVLVRSLATGIERSATTNAAGIYRIPALVPGSYSVRVSLGGLRDAQALVQVQVGRAITQDFKLQVGTAADTVQVTDTAALLRPGESSVSTVINRSLIDRLPMNGRKYTNLAVLAPNTSYDGDTGLVSIVGQQGGEDTGYANANGFNTFTVDGINSTSNYFDDTVGRYRIPYLYGENAIQEFQISAGPYSAMYGGGSGFVNAITRSGSNSFHGNVFYYNRPSATQANDAISKANGYPKPVDNLQQFGGSIGGPIIKKRLWFFADYEQQLRNDPIQVINSALQTTPANLSQFLSDNFGLPPGTVLPPPNGPLPVPNTNTAPDPTNPVYLQQVSNVTNSLNSNLGSAPRQRNDWVITSRFDYQPNLRDSFFLSVNYNDFNSPGGVITDPTVGNYGSQTLANAQVHAFLAGIGWTHAFSSSVMNQMHFGTSQDDQVATPTGKAPNTPTIILDSPAAFVLGNAPFSIGKVFERQYSFSNQVDYVIGKHTLQFGFEFSHAWDSDTNDGGADPNAAVTFGSPLGSYQFSNLESFALGQYNVFSQSAGPPTFSFGVSYFGFYLQDTYRILPNLTLEMGLRQDFQVYPQPMENPAFPLTGQYPNQFFRLAPRFGFSWGKGPNTVIRGGFGQFYSNMNGLNYRNAVISNGLPSQQTSVSTSYDGGIPNQQLPTFPSILPANSPLFQSSPDISLVSPQFRVPYALEASLQVEQQIAKNTTLTLGTIWSHGIHLIASSAYDLNLKLPQGTTTYISCPPGASAAPCSGPTIVLPNLDNGLLTEGRINPNLGQINEMISPGQNQHNALFVQVKRSMTDGLSLQFAYTWAHSILRDGADFNNQFDFSNTTASSLLDQRQRLTLAAVYQPRLQERVTSRLGRALLSNWSLSTVMEFSSGRPYAALLSPACTSSTLSFTNCDGTNGNLNNSAFNQSTANTAAGINGAGPTPGMGLNSFYGPWLQRIDIGLSRSIKLAESKTLELQVQAFNLFNHANYYVQNGGGVNALQYNPVGTTCGDGVTLNQTCYLVPNSGPGNFGTMQEIHPDGLPRALQFSARFTF